MRIGTHIARFLQRLLWTAAGFGMLVLCLAAVQSRRQKSCAGVEVEIRNSGAHPPFIAVADIRKMVSAETDTASGIPASVLHTLESKLEAERWVEDAQVYLDNRGVLRVSLTQRVPVARIIDLSGKSFYLDSAGKHLPLMPHVQLRLPVFTGYPSGIAAEQRTRGLDSSILELTRFIRQDPFWTAQVAQIHLTPQGEFEMAPTVGHHIVELGDAGDLREKFAKLYLFYKQEMTRRGMDAYSRIRVQFRGQVVGVRRSTNSVQNNQP